MCTTNGFKFTPHLRLWTILLNVFVHLWKKKTTLIQIQFLVVTTANLLCKCWLLQRYYPENSSLRTRLDKDALKTVLQCEHQCISCEVLCSKALSGSTVLLPLLETGLWYRPACSSKPLSLASQPLCVGPVEIRAFDPKKWPAYYQLNEPCAETYLITWYFQRLVAFVWARQW